MIGAVDIGGTKIAVGLADHHGRLHSRRQFSVNHDLSLKEGMREIASLLRATCVETGTVMEGIGIACTGQIDAEGRLKPNAFLPAWSGAKLADELSRILDLSAALENDADAAALGEATWGIGKGVSRFVLVTVGTGIGGGLVFDGRLYRGVDGAHPEIGHHVIDTSGPECFCGARGCWEQMASGLAMSRWMSQKTRQSGLEPVLLDAREICVRAGQGDPLAMQAVEREGFYLGLGLANLITIFAPDVIALGGSVMNSWELFSTRAREVIGQSCRLVPGERTLLQVAALGPDTSLIGAAQVWKNRFEKGRKS